MGRYDRAPVRTALWTVRAILGVRKGVREPDFGASRLPRPPKVSQASTHGVTGVLRRWPQTCLVRSVVLQHWLAAQGDFRDLIIGVTAPDSNFAAHAWLDGETPSDRIEFVELLRYAAK